MSVYSFSVSKSGVYGTAYVDIPSGYVYEVGASRAPVLPSIRMMSSHSAITDARYYQLELVNIYNSSGTVIGWASTNKSTSTAKGSYSASTSWQTGSAVDMPTVAELFNSSNPSAKQVSVRLGVESNHSGLRATWSYGGGGTDYLLVRETKYISPAITFKLNAPPTFSSTQVSFNTTKVYAGMTTASVTISSLSAKYGGTIASAVLKIGNQTASRTTNGTLSIALSTSGTFTPTVTVKDSRGQTTTKTLNSITVKSYSKPSVSYLVERTNSDGTPNDSGTYAVINPKITYTSDIATLQAPTVQITNEQGTTSTATVTWYSTRSSSGTLSGSVTWANVASGTTVYGKISGFEADKRYQITVTPKDNKGTGTAIIRMLGTAFYTMDFLAGGHGIGIGQASTQEGLWCAMPAHFSSSVDVTGTSGDMLTITQPTANTNAYYVATRTDVGVTCKFGVGSGGVNHGVWSTNMNRWLLYGDNTNVYVNSVPIYSPKVLWSGALQMTDANTLSTTASSAYKLSEAISAQAHGIVLGWSAYVDGSAQNYNWVYNFVPKTHTSHGSGAGFTLMTEGLGTVGSKYLYITSTSISGNAKNDDSGTASGITYNNAYWVLREVIGI